MRFNLQRTLLMKSLLIVFDDIGICNGDSGILTAIASTPGGVYTWSGFTETTESLEVNPTVTSSYTVVYELNNCTSQQ